MALFFSSTPDDDLPTHSSNEQDLTERACLATYKEYLGEEAVQGEASLRRES